MKLMRSKKKTKEIKAKYYDRDIKKWCKAKEISPGVYRIGKKGHKLGAFTLETAGLKRYRAYYKGRRRWGKRIKKYGTAAGEYAGNKKRSITAAAIKCKRVAFRAHLLYKDTFLPTVYGGDYDIGDMNFGFAGNKKNTIDFIEIWRTDIMPNFSEPTNPVGTYDPCYMTNLYGAPWSNAWNTAIYGSPTQTGANVLSNCVGYTQGRILSIYREITGYNPAQTGTHPFIDFNIQADIGWLNLARNKGYEILSEPEAGTVLVTGSHVAVVERLKNGEWWVSESGYDAFAYEYHASLYQQGGKWYDSWASSPEILGFFRIPETDPGGDVPPSPGKRKSKLLYYLKNWNNE